MAPLLLLLLAALPLPLGGSGRFAQPRLRRWGAAALRHLQAAPCAPRGGPEPGCPALYASEPARPGHKLRALLPDGSAAASGANRGAPRARRAAAAGPEPRGQLRPPAAALPAGLRRQPAALPGPGPRLPGPLRVPDPGPAEPLREPDQAARARRAGHAGGAAGGGLRDSLPAPGGGGAGPQAPAEAALRRAAGIPVSAAAPRGQPRPRGRWLRTGQEHAPVPPAAAARPQVLPHVPDLRPRRAHLRRLAGPDHLPPPRPQPAALRPDAAAERLPAGAHQGLLRGRRPGASGCRGGRRVSGHGEAADPQPPGTGVPHGALRRLAGALPEQPHPERRHHAPVGHQQERHRRPQGALPCGRAPGRPGGLQCPQGLPLPRPELPGPAGQEAAGIRAARERGAGERPAGLRLRPGLGLQRVLGSAAARPVPAAAPPAGGPAGSRLLPRGHAAAAQRDPGRGALPQHPGADGGRAQEGVPGLPEPAHHALVPGRAHAAAAG